jgi:hypothetical protein
LAIFPLHIGVISRAPTGPRPTVGAVIVFVVVEVIVVHGGLFPFLEVLRSIREYVHPPVLKKSSKKRTYYPCYREQYCAYAKSKITTVIMSPRRLAGTIPLRERAISAPALRNQQSPYTAIRIKTFMTD